MYDVIIIGSGVSGSAAARELSRYKADICVLEKEEDVCCGTSKANSGIVHAGYDAEVGSLMAKLNVRGNAMMEELSKDLDFPSREPSSGDLSAGRRHGQITGIIRQRRGKRSTGTSDLKPGRSAQDGTEYCR